MPATIVGFICMNCLLTNAGSHWLGGGSCCDDPNVLPLRPRLPFPRVMIVQLPNGFKDHPGYPWNDGDTVLVLNEIQNMPGHCVVVDKENKISWGFHTDNFREPTEDEL